jgi:hypothetical protein
VRGAAPVLSLAVAATAAAAITFVLSPANRGLTTEAWLLAVAALAVLGLTRVVLAGVPQEAPSAIRDALARRPPPPERPAELARLEREVQLATNTVFDFHFRLRPVLAEAAEAKLGPRAAELLEPEVWELIRPDAPRPADHDEPGPPLALIEATVTALERPAPR